MLDDLVLDEVVERVGRSTAQVVLRWHVQGGDVIVPRSVTPSRIQENFEPFDFELFDFELSSDDMDAITGLDKGEDGRTGPNPRHLRHDHELSPD